MLAIGSGIMLLLVYVIAIKSTNEQKIEYRKLKERFLQIDKAPENIGKISKRINEINQLLGSSSQSSLDKQEILMEKITDYCSENKCIVKEIPELHEYLHVDYIIETFIVSIEGNFKDLLKLLYRMEYNFGIGKISHVTFNKEQHLRTKRVYLTMTVYVQNIKSLKNE